MSQHNLNVISSSEFFSIVNKKRINNSLDEIENTLLARKMGILFAVKTDNYVNFKGDYIELNDPQLLSLQDILEEYFDVNMTEELKAMVIDEDEMKKKVSEEEIYLTTRTQSIIGAQNAGFLGKIKSLFGGNSAS